jgi:hypothetical protein
MTPDGCDVWCHGEMMMMMMMMMTMMMMMMMMMTLIMFAGLEGKHGLLGPHVRCKKQNRN